MKPLHIILIVLIVFGIGARFYGLGDGLIWRDEGIAAIAGIKLHHQNPYDARYFSSEHPPVGRWLIGLPSAFIQTNYNDVLAIGPHLFAFTYLTPFREVTVPMRFMVAFFGLVLIIFIFLITKELFFTETALFATALAALSMDFIAYSRILYTDMFALAFSAGTIYFYIKYLRSTNGGEWKTFSDYFTQHKRVIYLALMVAFLVLALGSRLLYPLFLIPSLIVSQLLVGRGWKQHIISIAAVLFALYLFLTVVYPPELQKFAFENHYRVSSYEGFLRPQLSAVKFIEMLFLRNSYAYAFSLAAGILALYSIAQKKRGANKSPKNVIRWLRTFNEKMVVVVVFALSFIIYSLTKYGSVPSYIEFIHIPLFVLGGYAISRLHPYAKYFAIFLLIISAYTITTLHPYYADYTNFNQKSFALADFSLAYDPQYLVTDMLIYLETLDGEILSNEQSVLFKTDASPLPPQGFPRCTKEFLDRFDYIVYRGSYSSSPSIQEDQFICPLIKDYSMEIIKTFKTEDPEDNYPFIIYRIVQPS